MLRINKWNFLYSRGRDWQTYFLAPSTLHLLSPVWIFFFFFSPASRFPSAFNQGQYVLNQHFSCFMRHCPLKLSAAGWQLHSANILRASPVVCTSVPFPELPKCPGGNWTWNVPESAYQALAGLRVSSYGKPSPWVVRGTQGGQQVRGHNCPYQTGSLLHKKERNLMYNLANGKYVIKTAKKHSDGGTELDRNQRPCVLGGAIIYSFSSLKQSVNLFYKGF